MSHVYTKEMSDNGELPSVGMECLIYYNEYGSRYNDFFDVEITILAVTNGVYTFYNPLLGYAALSLTIKTIKPLTPPIELIDGKAYQFELNAFIYTGFYAKARKSFMDRNVSGNKICSETEPSNIQLLEVK